MYYLRVIFFMLSLCITCVLFSSSSHYVLSEGYFLHAFPMYYTRVILFMLSLRITCRLFSSGFLHVLAVDYFLQACLS